MKSKLWTKHSLTLTLLVAVALSLLGLPVDRVRADPPDPTPGPAVDIRTKLQPYQTPGTEPAQTDGRLFEVAPPPPEVGGSPNGPLASQTFYATADATMLEGYPSQNFGDTADMWAGYDNFLEPDGKIARSLIKFDIASLPPNRAISTATLRVYLVASWDYPNTSRTITTYRATANWAESTVTWNNKPGYGGAYGSKSIGEDDFTWHEFDVTDLVRAWYDGTYTNYGIMLRGPEVSGLDSSWRSFSTREGPYPPQLVIEYDDVPEPPSDLTAQALSQTQIRLSWMDNSDNESGFEIERSPNGTSGWTQIATVGADLETYTDSDLTCGISYYYRVRAYNAAGNSEYSNVANATTSICPPDPPSNLVAASVSETRIDLAWDDNSDNESGFKIEWSPGGADNWTQIAKVEANVTTYSDIDLTCGTTYDYRVRAYNTSGDSSFSNIANATTVACPLDPPSKLVATPISETQIDLSWMDNSDNESGFKIERSPNGTSDWAQIAKVEANTTTYSDTGLTCNTPYHYRVRAYNASDDSDYSNTADTTTADCVPDPPSNLTAQALSQTQIRLSWKDNSDNESGFKIERSPGGVNDWRQIVKVGANITVYSDTNLICDKPYDYRVRAYNTSGDSDYSNPVNSTIAACNTETLVYLPIVFNNYPPLPDTLPVIHDAGVLQGLPALNFADTSDMWVGYDATACHQSGPGGQIARSLIQFDVSSIPPGTSISQATLHLRKVNACWSGSGTRTVTAYRVNNVWSELLVTWNTQPSMAEAYGSASIPLSIEAPDWYALDITGLVRGWVNDTFPNNGLMLRGPESSSSVARFGFATRDWSGTSFDPYISITYTDLMTTAGETTGEEITPPMACKSTGENIIICSSGGDLETVR